MAGDRSDETGAADACAAASPLARYVPEAWRARLDLPAHAPGALGRMEQLQVVGPLADLLGVAAMYVPALVVAEHVLPPGAPAVAGRFLAGTLLYADVSGFTALTARLCADGPGGAEEITRVMNIFFDPMVDLLQEHGGCLLRFGGDSLLALFPAGEPGAPAAGSRPGSAPRPAPAACADAVRAAACAHGMIVAMAGLGAVSTPAGPATLEMSVGLAAGAVFAASVGVPGERLEWLVTGEPVYDAARAEADAESGEVLLSAAAAARLGGAAPLTRTPAGRYRLDAPPGDLPAVEPAPNPMAGLAEMPFPRRVAELVRRIEALRPYLPAALFEKLEADPGHVEVPGEVRFVTSVFAHLAGLGALLDEWGPARTGDLTALLDDVCRVVGEGVAAHGGFLARIDAFTKGDKVLALFGTPVAHERDEESALACCRAWQVGLAVLNARWGTVLALRIGVNSGTAYCGNAGSLLRKEYTVMGDEVNLAARMMGRAADGQVLVGPATAARAPGLEFAPPQAIRFKGKEEPLAVRLLIGACAEAAGLAAEAGVSGEAAPTHGCEAALAALDRSLRRVDEGRGQTVILVGEAGAGKSHLLRELARRARRRGMQVFSGLCAPHGRRTPYAPWVGVLKRLFELAADEAPAVRADKIARRVAAAEPSLVEWAPLVGALLQVPMAEGPALAALDARLRRERLFDVVGALMRDVARRAPALIAFEDAAWLDPPSIELAGSLAEGLSDRPLLLAFAARPGDVAVGLAGRPGAVSVRLDPLDDDSCLALARDWHGGSVLPEAWRRPLLERARGNPLFLRELLQAFQRCGTDGAAAVPDTLAGLLLARVDRLAEPERIVLRAAAIVGPRFKLSTLAGLAPLPGGRAALAARVERVCRAELLEQTEAGPDPTYAFRQTLVQDAVYRTLPPSARTRGHRRAAEQIERAEADKLDRYVELLCHHWERAEDTGRLRGWLVRAGEKARAAYANAQAEELFTRAATLYASAAAGPAEDQALQAALRGRAGALRLLGRAPEALPVLEWALAGAEAAGDAVAVREALLELAETHAQCADYPAALARAEEAERRAGGDPVAEARALQIAGQALRVLGDPAKARECAYRSWDRLRHAGERADPRVLAGTFRGLASVYLDEGQLDPAHRCLERALEAARAAGDRRETSLVLHAVGNVHLRRGARDEALAAFQEALALAAGVGDREVTAACLRDLGQTALFLGRTAEAVARFGDALDLLRRIGARGAAAEALAGLAEARRVLGDYDAARKACDESLAEARRIGDAGLRARVLDLLGRLELARVRLDEAERLFGEALELRRRAGDRAGTAASLLHVAEVAAARGEHEAALVRQAEALAVAEESGDDGIRTRVQVEMAGVHARLANFAEARALLDAALADAAARRDEGGAARALARLGRLELAVGRPGQAVHRFEEAREKALAVTFHDGVLAAELGLGRAWLATGDTDGAREVLGRVRAAAGAGEGRHLEARRLLGVCLRLLGEFAAARAETDAVLAAAAEQGQRGLELDALADRAELAMDLGGFAAAGEDLERADRLARRTKSLGVLERVVVLAGWRELLAPDGRAEAAARRLEEAHWLGTVSGAPEWVLLSRAGLALVQARVGDPATGIALAEQALARAEEMGFRGLLPRLLAVAAAADLAAGQAGAAVARWRRAMAVAEYCGVRGMLWQLHAGLAQALAEHGDAPGAQEERGRAAAAAAGVAGALPDGPDRAAFLAWAPVQALLGR